MTAEEMLLQEEVTQWQKRYKQLEAEHNNNLRTIESVRPVVAAARALVRLNPILWDDAQERVDFCQALWDFEILHGHVI